MDMMDTGVACRPGGPAGRAQSRSQSTLMAARSVECLDRLIPLDRFPGTRREPGKFMSPADLQVPGETTRAPTRSTSLLARD